MAVITSQAVLGAGTRLYFTDASTEYEINEIRSIGTLGTTGSFVDVTPIDVTDNTRKYISGLQDTTENALTFNWIAADPAQSLLRALAQANSSVPMRIEFSNGEQFTWNAELSGFQVNDVPVDDALQAQVSYRADAYV